MLKHLKIAAIFLGLSLLLLSFGLYQDGKNFYTMSRGNYFFQNTRLKASLETIILDFGNGYKITITQREGLWRIKEADDYFASSILLNELFKFLTNTVIYRSDMVDHNQFVEYLKNGVHFISMDNNGRTLDEAVIAPQARSGLIYASLNNLPYLYQLNSEFKLSPILMDWVQMPIISIDYDSLERIDTDTFNVYRQFAGDEFKSVSSGEPAPQHLHRLTNNLHLLTAQEIKHITNFDMTDFQKLKHYDFTLLNGLIYGIDIYQKNEDYWMTVKLDKTSIAPQETHKILQDRQILYDGWFFKIDRNQGQIISDFIL